MKDKKPMIQPHVWKNIEGYFKSMDKAPTEVVKVKPAVNIIEKKEAGLLVLEMALPGFEKSDIEIQLNQRLLSVDANKKQAGLDVKINYREYSIYSAHRSFSISEDWDLDTLEAKYEQGILKLTIEKNRIKQSRNIEIK